MKDQVTNPFTITKASDFSDQQIQDYWVDLSQDGFRHILNPTSAMPMVILGSKGSGKTHLMRYFSYTLQKLRHSKNILGGIQQEGYLGIYLRCSGLNADRFSGKGQSPEVWRGVFSYYIELWLAQLLLDTMSDMLAEDGDWSEAQPMLCQQAYGLFDVPDFPQPTTIAALTTTLRDFQRQLDHAINNAVITRSLDVTIRTTPGRLIFGLPQLCAKLVTPLHNSLFVYLIDELEHFSEQQQRLINTLLREKESPCSVKIGARLYGIKTNATLSDNEENKQGSEYEIVHLDSSLRASHRYAGFAGRLCNKRINEAGYLRLGVLDDKRTTKAMDAFFEVYPDTALFTHQTRQIAEKHGASERPHFVKVRSKLTQAAGSPKAKGIPAPKDINVVLTALQCDSEPILEKVNILLLYQYWSKGKDLVAAAGDIATQCRDFKEGRPSSNYKSVLSHFKEDLFAQLLSEYGQKQRYLGFDVFVRISHGIPRHLLTILKHVVKWSIFNGEKPFRHDKISVSSQQDGVNDASEWFYDDARPGVDGGLVRDGVTRLANLFRSIRYSDKPSECSLITFSADLSRASRAAQRMITLAEQWSLLIRVSGGQSDRNSRRVDEKFQLNYMLAPRWDLPTASRGALALVPEEVNAIFDPEQTDSFPQLLQARVERMTAPFFGKKSGRSIENTEQGLLQLGH